MNKLIVTPYKQRYQTAVLQQCAYETFNDMDAFNAVQIIRFEDILFHPAIKLELTAILNGMGN